MANKKKNKKIRPLIKISLFAVMAFMLVQVFQQIKINIDLKAQLKDPDYIQSYARSNYMLSKDGEQIFYLPEKK